MDNLELMELFFEELEKEQRLLQKLAKDIIKSKEANYKNIVRKIDSEIDGLNRAKRLFSKLVSENIV